MKKLKNFYKVIESGKTLNRYKSKAAVKSVQKTQKKIQITMKGKENRNNIKENLSRPLVVRGVIKEDNKIIRMDIWDERPLGTVDSNNDKQTRMALDELNKKRLNGHPIDQCFLNCYRNKVEDKQTYIKELETLFKALLKSENDFLRVYIKNVNHLKNFFSSIKMLKIKHEKID